MSNFSVRDENRHLYQKTIELLKGRNRLDDTLSRMIDEEVSLISKEILGVEKSPSADASFQASCFSEMGELDSEKMVVLAETHFGIALHRARSKEGSMFAVPSTPALNLGNSITNPLPYTPLVHSLRAASQLQEIGKLSNFTSSVFQSIAFKPERMALQSFAVKLVLNYSLGKESQPLDEELASKVPLIVQEFLEKTPAFSERMCEFHRDSESSILAHLQSGAPLCEELALALSEASGILSVDCSMPIDAKWKALAMRAADIAYKKEVESELERFDISSCEVVKGVMQLPAQRGEARKISMINGGIASGKGTAESKMIEAARKNGVDWSEVLVINVDSFKKMLLDPSTLSKDHQLLFSGLSHDEASYIRNRVMDEYTRRLEDDMAPHLHVDQCWTELKLVIKAAEANPSGIDITMVQIPAEKSFAMAYGRGTATGRFESTMGVLSTHSRVPVQMITTIEALKNLPNANVRLRIVENLSREHVEEAAFFDFGKQKGNIMKKVAVLEFFKKTAINLGAKSFEAMYTPQTASLEQYERYVDKIRVLCPIQFEESA